MITTQRYHLSLTSQRDSIKLVEPFLRSISELTVLDQSRFHDLLVAITEAVNNAIIHGNKSEPTKSVEVDVAVTKKSAVFVITDEGGGFDPESVPDPRLPENILREGGRGVFLIKHLADNVAFTITDNGTSVAITYTLP